MPGKRRKDSMSRAEYHAIFDGKGEDWMFAEYLRTGGVRQLFNSMGLDFYEGSRSYYSWLHSEDKVEGLESTRWQRWQETRRVKAHTHVDRMDEEIEVISEKNYRSQRAKINAHDVMAQRLAPTEYGKQMHDVNVRAEVTLKSDWAAAMKELARQQAEGLMPKPWERKKLEAAQEVLVAEVVPDDHDADEVPLATVDDPENAE